ncbi:D-alanyl-D-alanine carboxypeptidase family protein [Magnetofaba australis]|nr:D-alanyl-D-alanine carboxypeptidase family protein [Magnetofaba australis]
MSNPLRLALSALTISLLLAQSALAQPFTVRAKSAILGDVDSGAILFEQNADEVAAPASLTKVMTLYILYEAITNGDLTLDSTMMVSKKAWKMKGSKTFVKVGDRVRVEDLIRGIAVQSGNDASIVVAEHIAGSEAGFADLMNAKAMQLGMSQSHFANASGFPAPNHYTTARDMLKLSSAFVANFPDLERYSQLKEFTYAGITQRNRNKLLWRDPTITGLKTGHTDSAGYCLIATNEKDGQRLASVIMGAESSRVREEEALRLLQYGNRTFETLRLFEAGQPVRSLRVWKGAEQTVNGVIRDSVVVTIPRKQRGSLEVGLRYDDPIVAPVPQYAQLGSLVVKLGSESVVERPVVAATAVEEGGLVTQLLDAVRLQLGW